MCDDALHEKASRYYMFDSDNKVVRVWKAVLSGVEILNYVADDGFVKRYSAIFELGHVFEWTYMHEFYVWMASLIASRRKLGQSCFPRLQSSALWLYNSKEPSVSVLSLKLVMIRRVFVYTAMLNCPTEANFTMPLLAYPVREMCDIIEDFYVVLPILAKLLLLQAYIITIRSEKNVSTWKMGPIPLASMVGDWQIHIFEKGYEKDPAIVAKEVIQKASRNGSEFGRGSCWYSCRMQKLADLPNSPNPRLINGILLTKFDTIDDKLDYNASTGDGKK